MKLGLQLGPYVVEEALTSGAMGALHRARHVETGAVVALKTAEHVVRANLRGLRREIRALRSVEHPNVVRFLDADLHATPPWYAMELIDGLPLNKHWSVVPIARRWKTYLGAFADICDGLAFVHGLGMVHRDLKPGNVVLRTSHRTVGEAVVVDFGLATVSGGGIGRERLYKRSEVVGTPQYISPEQVSQNHVDPRTDLYSLGCMLYEAVVGRPPFPADVPFVGMLKHINEQPLIPQEIATSLPRELTELIYGLLEKEPQKRPGYALDVRGVLAGLGDVGSNAHKPPARTYLHRPAFVGRQDLAEQFEEIGADVAAGQGGVVVVRGPAGTGKSRVAIELVRRVQVHADEHLEVLVAQSPNTATSAPLASLRTPFEEIADICTERGARFGRAVLGKEGALLARHLKVLRGVPGVGEIEPATVSPELLQQSTLEAVTIVLERMADHKPLALALDDVQWADPMTRLWLDRVRLQEPWKRVPLLLVLIARDDEGGDSVAEFEDLDGARTLRVGPLSDAALAEMVESMTGIDRVPSEFLAALRVDCRGTPSRAAQWLAAAVGRGALLREQGHWRFEGLPIENADLRDTITMSVSFEELLAQRIRTLDGSHRAVLDLAVVLGPELRPEVLSHLNESELAIIDGLVTDGVLLESGRGAVQFASADLHDVAKAQMGDTPRAELHVRAAAILEAVGAPVVEIAHHLALSGWRDEARQRLFAAGDEAFDAGEWIEAERRYAAAIEIGLRDNAMEVIARARLAILAWRHGRGEAALSMLDAAREACGPDSDDGARAELARAQGVLVRGTAPDKALAALLDAQRIFAETGEWRDERNVTVEVGNAYCRQGDFARGREVFTDLHDRARARGDDEGVAIALASVGATWISSRKYDAAVDFLERASERFRRLQSPQRLADALFNLGVCQVDRGNVSAGIAAFEEARDLRANGGDHHGAAHAQSALGHALLADSQPERAIEQLQGAVAMLERIGDRYNLAVARGYLGEAHAQLKHFTPAMDELVAALTIHRSLPYSRLQPNIHLEIARLHRRLGLYEDARVQLDKATQLAADDPYLALLLKMERAFLAMATTGGAAVDIESLHNELEAMQLPESSSAARRLAQLSRAMAARAEERVHGELRVHLPIAYR